TGAGLCGGSRSGWSTGCGAGMGSGGGCWTTGSRSTGRAGSSRGTSGRASTSTTASGRRRTWSGMRGSSPGRRRNWRGRTRTGRGPRVGGDRGGGGKGLRNRIANGIKYNDAPEKRVEVGVRPGSDPPVIFVRDNGIGIEPSHHAAVFRMFKRLHTQERYGGGS